MSDSTKHFAEGSRIHMHGKGGGMVFAVLMCNNPKHKNGLYIHWDDGTTGLITPYALNR